MLYPGHFGMSSTKNSLEFLHGHLNKKTPRNNEFWSSLSRLAQSLNINKRRHNRWKKCPSIDDDRGELSIDLIEKYIKDVIDALKKVKDLRLLINIDEIGFGRHHHYGKRRNFV